MTTLTLIHGNANCHICEKPKAAKGGMFCNYPHAMVPVKAVDAEHPRGFWTWEASGEST